MHQPSGPTDETLTRQLMTCRVIAAALTFGVIAFAVVAFVIRAGRPAEGILVSAIAAVVAAAAIVARAVVLSVLAGRSVGDETAAGRAEQAAEVARRRGVPETELPVVRDAVEARFDATATDLAQYQTRMIVGLAVLEGAAFFNLVAYIIEGRWWSMVAVAVLLFWMLTAFPTVGKLARWAEDRRQLREFGPNRA